MPKPSRRCPAAASAWSATKAKPARGTVASRWCGAGRGERRLAAATELRHARATDRCRLAAGRLGISVAAVGSASAEMQVQSAALPLHLVDLAFAVVLAAGLEREQRGVLREPL